nr:hypothetical protein K-LCC10_0174 [Kaumoebavirus]
MERREATPEEMTLAAKYFPGISDEPVQALLCVADFEIFKAREDVKHFEYFVADKLTGGHLVGATILPKNNIGDKNILQCEYARPIGIAASRDISNLI